MSELSTGRDWWALFKQFFVFGLVGGSGFVVNLIVAIILNKLNGGYEHAGNVMFPVPGTDLSFRFTHFVWIAAFIVANTWNYLLNRRWTFKNSGRSWWSGWVWFMAIGSVAAFVGLLLKNSMVKEGALLFLDFNWMDGSTGLRAREYWAQAISIILTMPINFIVNKLVTFRTKSSAIDL